VTQVDDASQLRRRIAGGAAETNFSEAESLKPHEGDGWGEGDRAGQL
jgi:hypothetical protein